MAKKPASKRRHGESLLVELLTEELPPRSLKRLSRAFADALAHHLKDKGFLEPSSAVGDFATPRRLAVVVTNVRVKQPDRVVERKGPAVQAGLDAEGKPTQALLGFARSCGTDVKRLERRNDDKGEYFLYQNKQKGEPLADHLAGIVEAALKRLPVAKVMRWGAGDAQFVRPVHGVILLHGAKVVRGRVLGLKSGNRTLGHRFLHRGALVIKRAADYEKTLERPGKVIASFERRRDLIVRALDKASAKLGNTNWCLGRGLELVDEVASIVENPRVYAGAFDPAFLGVPRECLIVSMQQHQKYFPVADAHGKLQPRFLFVSNMQPADPRQIIHGNERVLRARLADAKFFYDQDRKTTLVERVPRLAQVVYHNKLGSQLERVQRLVKLATHIARALGADASHAERAAYLAKADLLTDMVGEFPELQGLMGGYYARHDGEAAAVCDALADQYRLRFDEAGDTGNLASASLYLADRLETLIGFFGIGLLPSGDKDPFGLRRAALGVISAVEALKTNPRLAGRELPDVRELLLHAASLFPPGTLSEWVVGQVQDFILERYYNSLATTYPKDLVDAVISKKPRLAEVRTRVSAVEAFRKLPEADSLAAANKRIRNILRKSEAADGALDEALLKEQAERALYDAVRAAEPDIAARLQRGDYTGALTALAGLRAAVDAFFDKVLVNADDVRLRANRHALLKRLDGLMNQVADISKLAA
jgi:glycyl-tRNA synthetase beta chain